jgi:hypothetical protein
MKLPVYFPHRHTTLTSQITLFVISLRNFPAYNFKIEMEGQEYMRNA